MGEGYKVSAAVQQVYSKLATDAMVQTGIDFLAADHQQTIED